MIWKAPLLRGEASLKGNCGMNADDFCVCEVVRTAQAQILPGPVLRLENNYFDGQYKNPYTRQTYTERRAMLDTQTFIRNGDEIWWRVPVRLPADWIGSFPKWDELNNWPGNPDKLTGMHDGGALYQIHHMPPDGQQGDWSKLTIGSAPLYVHATHKDIAVEVNAANGTRTVLPLVRNFERTRRYEIVLHVKWSPDPTQGFVEAFVDGVQSIPLTPMATSYPGVGLYAIIGFYRREHIGDPSLIWQFDAKPGVDYLGFVPKKGARVFPRDDGYPQSVEYPVNDRPMMIATAKEDVMALPTDTGKADAGATAPAPVVATPAAPAAPTAPAGDFATAHPQAEAGRQQLVKQRPALEAVLLQLDAAIETLQGQRAEIQKQRDATVTVLNAGAWT